MTDALNLTATDDALACDGYTIVAGAVDAMAVDALVRELRPVSEALSGVRGGARNLLRTVPAVRDLAQSAALRAVAERSLGPGALAVRAILFDKTPGANWKVVWHQDVTIAVRERREVEGFGPWTEKEGVPHRASRRGSGLSLAAASRVLAGTRTDPPKGGACRVRRR